MVSRWSRRLHLTRGDKILVGILLLASLASFFLVKFLTPQGSVVVVEVDGQRLYQLDLSVDARRMVHGPIGETVIEILQGRVRVARSVCPGQFCVRTGWIDQAGQMIICVPNRVVVRIEGEQKDEVDGLTW